MCVPDATLLLPPTLLFTATLHSSYARTPRSTDKLQVCKVRVSFLINSLALSRTPRAL